MDISKTNFTELPRRCTSCGTIDETRPYGKDYQEICIKCCRKDPEQTALSMLEGLLLSSGPDYPKE